MKGIFFELVFVCLIICVCGEFDYKGIKMYECPTYQRQNCKRIYPNDRHYVLTTGIKTITKDYFIKTPNTLDVIGTPGIIEDIQPDSFRALPKLKRIWLGGQKINNIPYGIFNDLPIYYLYLAANYIRTIETEALDIKDLRRLYLDRNYLTYFDPNWFGSEKLTNFTFLYMHHNRVRAINRKAFYKFPRLTRIDFSHNEIEYIANDIFNHEADIESFDLRHNKLKMLDPTILKGASYIEKFSLAYNFLRNIDPEILNSTVIDSIVIHPNQWVCSCMREFEKIMIQKNIESDNSYATSLVCYESDQKCDENEIRAGRIQDHAFAKIINDTYNKVESYCRVDADCDEGHLCKSEFCWPIILKTYFSLDDDYYFLWIYY